MGSTRVTSSSKKSNPSSGRRPSSSSSDRQRSSSKHSDSASSPSKHNHSRSFNAKPSPSKPVARAPPAASKMPAAPPSASAPTKPTMPTTNEMLRVAGGPTASRGMPIDTTMPLFHIPTGFSPSGASASMPSTASELKSTAPGGAPPIARPIGGSMRRTTSNMGDVQGALGGFGSMGGAQGTVSGYGNMGGAQSALGGGFGSMGGGPDGMDANTVGSMYGMGAPMGSMYGMGGPMGSMYGMGGSMGSMYGMGYPMGSMYGMGYPMGSMYGMGGPMGSMYGMGAPLGSMYGMGGPMGSMYGMGGGSLYVAGYHSVIDAASRRDSFLNKNDLIRADVKPLNTIKTGHDDVDTKGATKKDAKVPKEAEKDVAAKKESTDKKPAREAKSAEKKAAKDVKETEKKEAKGSEKDHKEVEKKDAKETDPKNGSAKDKGGEKRHGEAQTGTTPATKSDGVLKFSGTKIRSLAIVYKSGKEAKVTLAGKDTVVIGGKETKLDEAVLVEDPQKLVEATALSEVRNQWVSGHNATIFVGSDESQRTQAVDFIREYLSTFTAKLASIGEYFNIYITMTALEGADQGRDLLKDGAAFEKLALASSPVYGPALNNMTTKEASTGEMMEAVLKEGLGRAKEDEMICSYLVLKQCRKGSAGAMVYLSSLNVTFVGPKAEHLTGLKDKRPELPCRLYRYSVGGGSHTACIGFVSDADASAAKVFDALKEMREVENTEPRSGNVRRFIEYTKKEIPKCKEKVASTLEENKKANYQTMLKRMEMMLKDAEDLEKNPKTVAPKAYM